MEKDTSGWIRRPVGIPGKAEEIVFTTEGKEITENDCKA